MPEPTQPSNPSNPPAPTPPAGDPTPPANPGTTPPANPPAFDASKLTREQVNQVLENPELWSNPRIAALVESDKNLKKLQEDKQKAEDEKLKADKKWEELSTKKEEENQQLRDQIKNSNINQALTSVLVKENVVDLDGALKLIDRSKVSVDDNGTVSGVQDAIDALKAEKTYLFNGSSQPTVGNPSNPTPGSPSGPMKFKRSQLTQEFINANKDEVYKAMNAGLIEDDGPPPAGQ